MAGELKLSYTTNLSTYAVIVCPYGEHGGQFWNNTTLAFEEFSAANWTLYRIPLAESNGTGLHFANMPAVPFRQDHVDVFYYQRVGATATVFDTKIRAYQYALTGGHWVAGQQIAV